jgi:hypothetical protein
MCKSVCNCMSYTGSSRNAFDFQGNGLIRQDVAPESKLQRFALVDRRNTDLAPYPNAGTLQRPA